MPALALPGLAGFWAEFFTFRGAFALVPLWAAFGTIGIVITAVYILWRIIQNVFLGEYDPNKLTHWTTADGQHADGPTDMVGFEKVTLWPLVALMFITRHLSDPGAELLQQLCAVPGRVRQRSYRKQGGNLWAKLVLAHWAACCRKSYCSLADS